MVVLGSTNSALGLEAGTSVELNRRYEPLFAVVGTRRTTRARSSIRCMFWGNSGHQKRPVAAIRARFAEGMGDFELRDYAKSQKT